MQQNENFAKQAEQAEAERRCCGRHAWNVRDEFPKIHSRRLCRESPENQFRSLALPARPARREAGELI
ncbi:TPA: hypothetical protein L3921_006371 [Pseudomonas aeruginosa]|uniref:hypothetical protein n=1 Tax=Pseudomonas aeruginosa TaxID=287 RepID=UPI00292D38D9|nr:hypothetical protein [Pseudomonas aeruginosa]WNZ20499.1 hypothetical protein QJQ47_12475 [Pseudomonas aeruginosa]HBN9790931.1 hypothetical protein [Pseudomonas aeruginosa]